MGFAPGFGYLTGGDPSLAVPRLGTVRAGPQFRLIAAMNTFDAIGTARVSHAIADRICRVVLGYQDAAAEQAITAAATGVQGPPVALAVTLTRATREHGDVRMGSSVRGAIDLVLLLTGLQRLRGETRLERDTARDAVHAALSGRIRIADGCDRSPESVLDEILGELWPDHGEPDDGEPDDGEPDDQGKAGGLPPNAAGQQQEGPGRSGPGQANPANPGPSRSSLRRDRSGGGHGAARRTLSRAELSLRHAAFGEVSPEVGELDEAADRA